MPIKKDTIAKFARNLTALGCSFKIIEEDGTEHGSLEVVAPKARRPRSDILSRVDYKTALDKIKVGDVVELYVPDGVSYASVQSSVSAYANKLYGAGAITSSANHKTKTLEVLRLQ